ncbi:MAG: hypothetical protein IPO30_02805 [Hyphomonadaceae bacterium]|jgi:hypothetical protein|nr:hypothetical protein [Hyphomonadaceae bacterium]
MRMLKPALVALAVAIMASPAMAQVPKAADGKPDLTGFWTHASLTPLTRAPSNKTLVVSEMEAKKIASGYAMAGVTEEGFKGATYSDPTKGAPPKGGKDFGVQAYDSFWMDPGARLALVNGEWRTSHVIEPADGQLPYVDPVAQAKRRADRSERYETGNAAYEGPEATNIAERCILGFSNAAGPGMLSGLYNSNYRFVQSPGYMMILAEMAHDARIIPIFASAEQARANRRPSAIKPWFGDSVGWWEGDTFVMESTNINPVQVDNQSSFPISEKAVITERFTRTSEKDIVYEFGVNDPETYTKPWKAQLSFYPSSGVYEYACHEGNYGMHGILAGAREKERRAELAKGKSGKMAKGGQ